MPLIISAPAWRLPSLQILVKTAGILPLPAEQIEHLPHAEASCFEVRLELTARIMQQFVYSVSIRPPVPHELVERNALEEDGL
jgi:hypothetical protein